MISYMTSHPKNPRHLINKHTANENENEKIKILFLNYVWLEIVTTVC